ncbi:DUF6230 family protein [Kitasatospora sp. LaBMicrA B282]|uniref:DUF6230 family protein n=1 Tax=Kitasatospora sp. LaBMicrA B282 TaxID=3420949 RepID=UPI003D1009CC
MDRSEELGVVPDGPEPQSAEPPRRGRVRLRRAALMAIPACVAGGVLMVMTAQGVLAAQFAISGLPFTVTATNLDGHGFEQYGDMDHMIPHSPNQGHTGGQVLVAVSAIKTATLSNLCQSVNLGGINLKITAGGGSSPVQATNLTTDSDVLSGDASFTNIEIGNDASTLDKAGVQGRPGVFGQQADRVVIQNLRQNNWATTAGSFTLPGMHLSFSGTGC